MRQVVGIHSVRETLKIRPKAVRRFCLRDGWKDSKELADLAQMAQKASIKIEVMGLPKFEKLARGHQGVLAEVVESPMMDRDKWDTPQNQLVLGLDGLEDPQNLGAIIRTSWLMGVDGIFLPRGRAAPLTPAACKAASGGTEHVPVEIHSNLTSPVKILKEKGFWVFGLSESARSEIWSLKAPEKVVWIVGAEGAGIRAQTEGVCDEFFRLPQTEKTASYNASVAVAMALFETKRQWVKTAIQEARKSQ